MPYVCATDLARKWGVSPRVVSDLFYARAVPDDRAPVVGGRRMIPADLEPEIKRQLVLRGKLNEERA